MEWVLIQYVWYLKVGWGVVFRHRRIPREALKTQGEDDIWKPRREAGEMLPHSLRRNQAC